MKLLEQLKNQIPYRIFQRGKNYYKRGHIVNYHLNKTDQNTTKINAVVSGTKAYQVELDVELTKKRMEFAGRCNCPYWGDVCKHQVAVLHQFLLKDFKEIKERSAADYKFKELVNLVEEAEVKQDINLKYKIKGLEMKSMVNFKLTIESDELSDRELEELVDGLHYSSYHYYNHNNLQDRLALKDQINLSYFKGVDTSKSSTDGALLFTKNKNNFNYILNLIQENQVYLEESNLQAKVGKLLRPQLIITGDLSQVQVEVLKDQQAYQGQGVEWLVVEGVVHPVRRDLNLELPVTIDIPQNQRGSFLFELLPSLQEQFSARLADSLQGYQLQKGLPEIKLEFDYSQQMIECRATVKALDKVYNHAELIGFDLEEKDYQQDQNNPKLWTAIDTAAIEELLRYLEEYNFHVKPEFFYIKEQNHIQEFISGGIDQTPEYWQLETTTDFDNLEIVEVELKPIIEFEENDEGINWFEFKVSYQLAGQSYSREELRSLLKQKHDGSSYIQIDNKYFMIQEGAEENNLQKIIDNAEVQEDGSYRSSYYNLLYYQNLVEESGIKFKGNRVYNQLNKDITEEGLVKEEELPGEVEDTLRDYQKQGYYWMKFLYRYNFAGILADDMGLGKTLQTLTLLKSIDQTRPALIVCPRTLIYNWSAEIEKFFTGINYLVYYGSPEEREEMREELSEYEIIITSYSIISRDYELLGEETFSYCILDEAHHIKNRRTKRTKGIKEINSRYKLALTGTPLENSLEELWSIFDFLMPGYLNNFSQFRKKYLNPIKKEQDRERLEELKNKIAPFILRRKKEEVLDDLPEKMINIYPVEMNKFQADTYELILEELKEELTSTVSTQGFNRSRINILAALTKLRQICDHPNLVLDEANDNHSSGKLDALLEIVEEAILAGHKLIIFSQFVTMLKLIRQRFIEKEINFEYLDGSTKDRMKRVDNFNNSDQVKAFLISLKAGGIGLNLTSADIVVHVDPWWNPMVERQATDRAHRIGQKNKVIVYKLITTGTVEEKMLKLQEKKKDIFESVIEDNVSPITQITWDDIQQLLE